MVIVDQAPEHVPPPPRRVVSAKTSSKLQQLTGESGQQRLANSMDQVLTDPTSSENKALKAFTSGFDKLAAEKIRKAAGGPPPADQLSADPVCEAARGFLDSLFSHMQNKRLDAFVALRTGIDFETEEGAKQLTHTLELAIERNVLPLIMPRIHTALAARTTLMDEEELLLTTMFQLKRCSQSDFQVPRDCKSTSQYAAAIRALNALDSTPFPLDKLELLIKAANTVFEVHASENVGTAISISGDDFLPIFAFCLARSSITQPVRTCVFCCLWLG